MVIRSKGEIGREHSITKKKTESKKGIYLNWFMYEIVQTNRSAFFFAGHAVTLLAYLDSFQGTKVFQKAFWVRILYSRCSFYIYYQVFKSSILTNHQLPTKNIYCELLQMILKFFVQIFSIFFRFFLLFLITVPLMSACPWVIYSLMVFHH